MWVKQQTKIQKKRDILNYLLVPQLIVTLILLIVPLRFAHAATFSTARDKMNTLTQSLTTGVSHTVTFTVPTGNALTEASVQLIFPDADDGLWCRTAGADVTVATSTDDGATGLPGTLTAACTQGAGASSYDTITVSGVTNLSASTMYGFVVSDGTTAKLGTPTAATSGVITVKTRTSGPADIDQANIAVDIITNDTVSVSAIVDPTLTFTISDNSLFFGALKTSGTSCWAQGTDPGDVTCPTTSETEAFNYTVATNATNGYIVTLTNSGTPTTLQIGTSGPTITAIGAVNTAPSIGTEQFGLRANASGGSGAVDAPYAASGYALDTAAFPDQISSSAGASATTTYSVRVIANISATTEAGNYSASYTFIATAKF